MNTENYLQELEKHLASLPKDTRDNIIRDIKNTIDKHKLDDTSIFTHFGQPIELAKGYLSANAPKGNIWSKAKTILAITAMVFIAFIIMGYVFYYFAAKDDFDFSKYNARTISDQVTGWTQVDEEIHTIDTTQAKATFYWGDDDFISFSCEGADQTIQEGVLKIMQSKCYFILPATTPYLKVSQSDIVFIRPQSETTIKLQQARLRIAYKEGQLNLKIKKTQSKIEGLSSSQDGTKIHLQMTQARAEKYEY